ncbi:hypothetical protein B296_00013169 [Ensete ventricosum]|uniref:Uncharacterized protein n=1 Tax=Ensete ventricosum TaxID=4639 RepID=A0A426ZKD8_ENSVE|nr:hypothetical protein B296_00013169 [Ensete ventricosum]
MTLALDEPEEDIRPDQEDEGSGRRRTAKSRDENKWGSGAQVRSLTKGGRVIKPSNDVAGITCATRDSLKRESARVQPTKGRDLRVLGTRSLPACALDASLDHP